MELNTAKAVGHGTLYCPYTTDNTVVEVLSFRYYGRYLYALPFVAQQRKVAKRKVRARALETKQASTHASTLLARLN